ncbi:hypothetical protein CANARDRAFT_27664 [[Candida] arabinofermentans NRRL YB-2248]|uniref:(S)-ureidoglycine aminohydrolase cupin domain-containing protein n=1 Tax=[Candida] arabinofermentans NRRL YB-2248 TaxID=983967 RepID=A0A1E4T3W3_9ASCO|nr:hypothetical protein CANARDRAFT_27664 [[Candida] arabinofermentans NRRL YB-2248]
MPMTILPKSRGYDILPASVGPTSYLEDTLTSSGIEADRQITSGFYKQVAGEPLVYTYPYDEMKVVLDVKGTVEISDETGYKINPQRGDVLYFKKGCTITFKAYEEDAYGYFFYTGLKQFGVL